MKGRVAMRSKQFTLAHVEELLQGALASVTQQMWASCCAHVQHVEDETGERDALIGNQIEPVIISTGG